MTKEERDKLVRELLIYRLKIRTIFKHHSFEVQQAIEKRLLEQKIETILSKIK